MRFLPLALGFLIAAAGAVAIAQTPANPSNDLLALGQGFGQSPAKVATAKPGEPPVQATPRAVCEPGTRTEPGIQGRIPAGAANDGLACNVTLVSHEGTSGGFKVLRYTDAQGHDCAYYDTTLLFPSNAFHADGTSAGVAVLDMTDPAHPVKTDSLTEAPMLSPHESVNLNPKRGLLAAVSGNPSTLPGFVSIYDVSGDCRKPVLQSTSPVARLGHESGFAPDGRTFYATATAEPGITAVDVTDPKHPHAIWQGNVKSHGMTVSDDGNRAYIADPGGEMLILDTSEIQARKDNPQAREVSRLTWQKASIPQNAIPFTKGGKPYVLEFDEYTAGTSGGGGADEVGAGRIIDISDETKPRSIAQLRLQVDQTADHAAASGDPGAQSPVQGYAAHYCNIPTQVDPQVVACSFIASGLRVFDISDLTAPKEIAYFAAPTKLAPETFGGASEYAMSKPAFVPERREVWYSDGASGFYALRVAASVWPGARSGSGSGSSAACLPRKLKVSARGVGRIRVGARRDKVLSVAGAAPMKATSRSLRFCVQGGGRVLAALDRRGRVTAVFSTAKGHRAKAVARGTARKRAARHFRHSVRLRPSLVVLYRGRLVAGVKGRRVRFVGAVDKRRARSGKALRAELRRLGL